MKIYIPLLVLILCLACEKDPTIPLGKGNFPNIATIDISAIIGSTALSGVQINSIPTNYILQEKGICWALSPNPTTDNHALSISPSANGQINLRDLIPNTKYYARAYGKFNNTYYYGPEVSFTSANQEVSLSNGLVAYFPLNGSSVDFSSSKNNMTGNAIYGSGRKGIKNTAVSFNGTSSYYL